MPTDLPLRCRCGALRGVARDVTPARVNRVVCFCRFCRSYAEHLERAEEVLDEHGGTEVIQMSPHRLELTDGIEHLACLRLTATGALRWYTSCCRSPVANTLPHGRLPFMGLIHTVVDRDGVPGALDDAVGPVRARVNGQVPRSRARELRNTRAAFALMMLRFARLMAAWRLAGHQRRSPFFDPETLEPVRTPERVRLGRPPGD
ncbi:MAG: DUF6151 family protein [Sandaracinaceae bacterium]